MTPRAPSRANAVFTALANPDRRKMLDLLRGNERSAGDLCEALPDLPQPDVSRHLRVLREAGLVEANPRGQRRIYRLRPESLREVDGWVSTYRDFWSGRLDNLGAHLGEMKKEE